MRRTILLAAVTVLAGGAAQPATLGPPVTGSMYNGNNAHPAPLQRSTPAQVTGQAQNSEATTGAQIPGGHGTVHGGGG